jgi:hypothetical protein
VIFKRTEKYLNLSREAQDYINRYQIIYKRVMKEAKRRENDRYVLRAKNRTKAMWHIINKAVGKSLQFDQKSELNNGSVTISDPQKVADMMNSFFVGIVDDLLNQNSCNINIQTAKESINYCPNSIFLLPVTESEIECVTKSLKGKSSPGFDDIPESLVKQCIQYIKKPLTHIHNISFKSGTVPDRLKIAKVKPLFKKGDIHDVQNYRPISTLSGFSTLLKKLMHNMLISFVVKNNILNEAQNGFRENASIDTASQTFIESIQEALDKRLHATGLFFDLSKAYDVINHDLLLDKLNSYGITGITNLWFKSYLTQRV